MRLILTVVLGVAGLQLGCAHSNTTAKAAAPAGPAAAPGAAAPGVAATALAGKKPQAEKPAADSDDRMICSRGGDSRLMKMEILEPKGCRLLYPNASNQIAASSVGSGHCVEVRAKIRKNLEGAGFKCSEEAAKAPVAAVAPAGPAK